MSARNSIETVVLFVLFVLVACLEAACTGGTTTVDKDMGPDTAIPDVTPEYVDNRYLPDERSPDLPGQDVFELVEELPPACTAGCFLSPCESGADCESGWCVDHLGNQVCTIGCVDECPQGWVCQQVGLGGPDVAFICVSKFTHLCRPCVTAADCKSPTGVEDVCIDFGAEGRFCGGACKVPPDCPDGYTCELVMTVAGAQSWQCVPTDGVCECSEKSAALGLATSCYLENEIGTCTGDRICGEGGLTPCSAATPAEEACDGADNDCDGDTDEDTCDDGNECTQDSCLGAAGCQNDPLDGFECKDGDICTVADHCIAGECIGSPVICDDSNLCTDDMCNPTGGCSYVPNYLPCDDGDPCTVGDGCSDGKCSGTTVPCDCMADKDCAQLEDGNLCNGTLVCDMSETPFKCRVDESTVVTCPASDDVCLASVCDPESGKCGMVPDHEGFACSDGDACTIGDACGQGSCVAGIPLVCADNNPCTDDSCDSKLGCAYTPNSLPCDDADVCTVGDVCKGGACLPGTVELPCDDANPCTDDSCNPKKGCLHAPNALPCDDGNLCTQGDLCGNGSCVAGPLLVCNDANPCTDDSCNPELGCVYSQNQAPCSDETACTVGDTCTKGACVGTPVVCNDNNPCTDDSCDPLKGCVFTPNAAACDDGNACTTGDKCDQGKCKFAGTLDCDDGEVCTTNACDPKSGCVTTLNTLPCNDGNACTAGDVCTVGKCSGVPLTCDDKNPCTDDSCDPLKGCLFAPNAAACDDGNACTTGDVCAAGKCTFAGTLPCDDGNVCTTDSCDPKSGCVSADNNAPCNDGNPCTSGDTCSAGKCQGNAILCNDNNPCTDDSCDPLKGCVFAPNSLACDDGNACTTGDICSGGKCTGPAPTGCNDANDCTFDWCHAVNGCQHQPMTPCCGDGLCDPLEGCNCGIDCAVAEVCDGKDNDCKGGIDDGLGTTTCGVGICLHTVDNCVGGKLNACDPKQGAVKEICGNSKDDDCDGGTDEVDECPLTQVPCTQGTNILQNAGFESGSMSPWTQSSSYSVVAEPYEGSFSVKSVGNQWIRQNFNAVPGSSILEISFYTKKGAAGMPMAYTFYYSDGTSKEHCCVTAGTSWQFANVTNNLDKSRQLTGFQMWGYSGSGGNQSWIDSVRICRQ